MLIECPIGCEYYSPITHFIFLLITAIVAFTYFGGAAILKYQTGEIRITLMKAALMLKVRVQYFID